MTELSVSKKSVGEILSGNQLVIPDYQRQYSWDKDKCDTLWTDITGHFDKSDNIETDEDYFLGTIVIHKNTDNNSAVEVIDGQQRIITLLLLLRAFYEKLAGMTDGDEVRGLKHQIAPCIWEVNKLTKIPNKTSKVRVVSKVITTDDNKIFESILSLNNDNDFKNCQSLYSDNYSYFQEKCREYAGDAPMRWYNLCVAILNRCILIPIMCDGLESALDIFNTLNDRGLPLSDSDVFKARIYRNKKQPAQKKEFAESWKELETSATRAGVDIQDLFRYYTHYLRGHNNDISKEIGLRRFYTRKSDEYKNCFEENNSKKLIDDLLSLLELWDRINNLGNENYQQLCEEWNIEGQARVDFAKYILCLKRYPNEYWKFLVSVFYLKFKDDDFGKKIHIFLGKLLAFLFAKFIENPTVNHIKTPVYKECVNICKNKAYEFPNKISNADEYKANILTRNSSKISSGLILLHAHLHDEQKDPIFINFQTEHIFPKKWQSANYNGWNKEDAGEFLERFGNKVAIERRLNIQAGNNYFGNKKEKYNESKIQDVLDLSKHPKDDWIKKDIEERDQKFAERILNFITTQLKSS